MITKEKAPWIRVSEQLPEDGELVLTRLEAYYFEPKLNVYGIQKTETIFIVI